MRAWRLSPVLGIGCSSWHCSVTSPLGSVTSPLTLLLCVLSFQFCEFRRVSLMGQAEVILASLVFLNFYSGKQGSAYCIK